jgi:hypothetical protein
MREKLLGDIAWRGGRLAAPVAERTAEAVRRRIAAAHALGDPRERHVAERPATRLTGKGEIAARLVAQGLDPLGDRQRRIR